MNLMSSLVLFSVCIVVYIVIIEIFTVLFRLTGLTREKARTQVISLLTNSGFTTSESEVVMASKKRRRLAQVTMLVGYSFAVIIVSILVNFFMALNQAEVKDLLGWVVFTMAGLVALFLLMRLKAISSWFDHTIERLGNRVMFGRGSNVVVCIDNYSGKAMVEVILEHIPEFLRGVPLANTQLKGQYDIQILLIRRAGEALESIDGDTMLQQGDMLMLFGNYKNIRTVFERAEVG